MKKIYITVAMLTALGAAQATETTAGPVSVDNNTKVVTSSSAQAFGGSNGDQTMVFAPTYNTPSTQTVNYTGGTTSVVKNEQVGVIKSDQNVTQNATVKTEQVGVIKSDQNVTSNQTVNGKTEQVVSGGTNSVLRQEFGTQTIKNTPSVSGPPLTASNDTCMGSASGSANGPGFGISLGKTYTDANCVMLKNAREMWNMGMKAAAMARMCMDDDNRKALEMTGFTCPQSEQRRTVIVERQAALNAGEPVDPIVRERMGLPKIKE